tara:strand:+ start:581 stop:757 length:177 start_codon:yes stop_codon:yes gene_type:complete
MHPIAINFLISAFWELVESKDNNLTGDQVKQAMKKQIGDNVDVKDIIKTAALELGKRL